MKTYKTLTRPNQVAFQMALNNEARDGWRVTAIAVCAVTAPTREWFAVLEHDGPIPAGPQDTPA